ncbi:MAG: thermopsin family protease [Thermoplasmata archaeon]
MKLESTIKVGIIGVVIFVMVLGGMNLVSPLASSGVHADVGPAPAVSVAAPSASQPAPGGFATASARAATVQADEEQLLADGGNTSLFEPPNLHQAPSLASTQGHVVPLYSGAPAPIGAAYYGLNNTTGTIQATTMGTTSLQGYFSTSDTLGVQTEEFDFGTQTTYGAQLNAVLTNVTLHGVNGFGPNTNAPSGCTGYYTGAKSNYCPNQFWLQNVINYATASHSLSFENNIWNFSNPSGAWATTNGLTLRGRSNPSGGFYAVNGPSFTISYPFTVVMYLNTTVGACTTGTPGAASCSGISAGPVNEVFFNYTVYNSAGHVVCPTSTPSHTKCGEYDDVFWNSISASINPSGVAFGSAQIQANGTAYDPLGLTNDWEMDWGIGSSSGATTAVVYANAQVGINYCPKAHTNTHTGVCSGYEAPPAAYDYGGETGETTSGAYGYWEDQTALGPNPSFLTPVGAPVVRYVTGPSILHGLWNASASGPGANALNYRAITPANAWVGIASGAGVTNQSKFQVAPTFGYFSAHPGSGGSLHGTTLGANLDLAPGMYTVEVELSGYDPTIQTINLASSSQTPTIALTRDASTGVYTPMWAFSASDLANLSTSGAGTSGSPYELVTGAGTVGSPYGVAGSVSWLFSDLNDYLFTVWLGAYINGTHAYATINPAPEFKLVYPSWQYAALNQFGIPRTDGLQYYLFHAQNFTVEGATNIYSWANSEATSLTSVVCNTCLNDLFANDRFNVSDLGISLSGSTGALVHNTLPHARNVLWGNTFVAASQPTYAGLTAPSRFVTETDSFDRIYNNYFDANLTISETSTTNINFWNVTCQGGYATLSPGYYPGPTVCQPTSFSQSMNGVTLTGSIVGTNYQGGNAWFNFGGYANPYANIPYVGRTTTYNSGGIGQPSGHRAGDFAPLISARVYKVPFTETGLASSTSTTAFAIAVKNSHAIGNKNSSATNAIAVGCSGIVCANFYLPNGSYTFTASTSLAGIAANPASGSFSIAGAALSVTNINFGTGYVVTFTETGLPSGITWYVNVTGVASKSTTTAGVGGNTLPATLPSGGYTYHVASANKVWAPSYTPSFTVAGAALPVAISFSAVKSAVTFTESGLPGGTEWWVNVTGQTSVSSTGTTIGLSLSNASYTYAVASADKHYHAAGGGFSVHGSAVSVSVAFGSVTYGVTFTESGLPAGTSWSVIVDPCPPHVYCATNITESSVTTTIGFLLENGSYGYTVSSANTSWSASGGTFSVGGASVAIHVEIGLVTFAVTLTESGLLAGTTWYANSSAWGSLSSSSTTISTVLPNGSYHYTIATVDKSYAAAGGSFAVAGALVGASVSFSLVTYTVTVSESGLPYGTTFAVTVNSVPETLLTDGGTDSLVFTDSNGTYAYSIGGVAGYYQTTLPYNGNLAVNGASVTEPTLLFSQVTYSVTFTESGLPGGTSWAVTLNGDTLSSTGTTIAFAEPNGTYAYHIDLVPGFGPTPSSGSVLVDAAPVSVAIAFVAGLYQVSFLESNLPVGTTWSVTLGATTLSSTGTSIEFMVPNATYSFHVGFISGFQATPSSGSVTVNGAVVTVGIQFSGVSYSVTFTETGLGATKLWKVDFGSAAYGWIDTTAAAGVPIVFSSVPNGTYGYLIHTNGAYRVSSPSPTGTISMNGASVSTPVTFVRGATYSITFKETGLGIGTNWCVIIGGEICSTSDKVAFTDLSPGTYAYAIQSVGTLSTFVKLGALTVGASGSTSVAPSKTFKVTFASRVTFTESGLPASTSWSVSSSGQTVTSTSATIVLYLTNGTHGYAVGHVAGYRAAPASGRISVAGAPVGVSITFVVHGGLAPTGSANRPALAIPSRAVPGTSRTVDGVPFAALILGLLGVALITRRARGSPQELRER